MSAVTAVRRRRRRRVRIVLEALVLAVGVLLLGWGADRLARAGAESLLERNIQQVTGVAELPQVRLADGLVLHQAIRGAYGQAEVSVRGIRSGPLEIEQVQAQLYDVRLPLEDLLLRDIRRVGIGHSSDLVTLRLDDLNSYFEATGRQVRLTSNAADEVQLTGFFVVLGQTVRVTGPVELTVDGSLLRVTPRDVDTGDVSLSPARRVLLDQRLNLTVPLDTLPFGYQLTDVVVDDQRLRLTAEGTVILLRP